MFLFFCFIFVFLSNLYSSSRDECFSKIEGTVPNKEISLIDAIYVINLDRRVEKFEKCQFYLNKYNLVANRFSAVDGRLLKEDFIEKIGLIYTPRMKQHIVKFSPSQTIPSQLQDGDVGKTCFYKDITAGALGCYLSHISVLKDAHDRGFEYVWVLEDDFILNKDPRILSTYIKELDQVVGNENWDILFTDDLHFFSKQIITLFSRPDLKEIIQDFLIDSKEQIDAFKSDTLSYEHSKILESTHFKKLLKHKNAPFYLSCYPDCLKKFRRISGRWAIHSMIVKKSAIEKILGFYLKRGIFLPYDDELAMIPELKMYNLKEGITGFETLFSDTSGL